MANTSSGSLASENNRSLEQPFGLAHRAIRAVGARLFFLPPYSRDPKPIEQASPNSKTLLRTAVERTVEATLKRIGALLDAFTPAGMRQLFQKCRISDRTLALSGTSASHKFRNKLSQLF